MRFFNGLAARFLNRRTAWVGFALSLIIGFGASLGAGATVAGKSPAQVCAEVVGVGIADVESAKLVPPVNVHCTWRATDGVHTDDVAKTSTRAVATIGLAAMSLVLWFLMLAIASLFTKGLLERATPATRTLLNICVALVLLGAAISVVSSVSAGL